MSKVNCSEAIGPILRSLRSGRPFLVRNSLGGKNKKEPLVCRNGKNVTWYSCGPTVYDDAHIGHALTFVSFDVIRRVINNLSGKHVDFALGITDVDEKIRDRATERKVLTSVLAQHYENRFFADMNALNVLPPTKILRAGEHVNVMKKMVKGLISKEVAYHAQSGSVYFSVSSRGQRYGQLEPSRGLQELDGLQQDSNTNTVNDSEKRQHEDFAIWKKGSDENVTYLDEIWKEGRPGWHIECSAMILDNLGSQIDIHSGGLDLRFPHHTNELATAEAHLSIDPNTTCNDPANRWAHTWLHSGQLLVENKKMSKSLKNFVTVRSFLENGGCADTFRIFCMLRKYSSPAVFTERHVENAFSFLSRVRSFISRNPLQDLMKERPLDSADVRARFRSNCPHGNDLNNAVKSADDTIDSALTNDFDTYKVLSEIAQLIQAGNKIFDNQTGLALSGHAALAYEHAKSFVISNLLTFGISRKALTLDLGRPVETNTTDLLASMIEEYVRFRAEIRKAARDQDLSAIFKACDDTRSSARERCGINVTDLKDGSSSWARTRIP